ncbi:MAG: oxygenase MpaB family protein [Conexibacter sp.]
MSDHGRLASEGVSWRIKRESVVALGAGRELLLQIAHPEVGAGAEGAPFDDAELRWLWATRLETSLLMYTRYVRPLKVADVEAYYAEQRASLAECVPGETVPATFADFMHWYDGVVEHVLEVTPTAREVADALLRPRRPLPLRPAYDALNLATIGLLPPTLREAYGLSWGPQRERLLGAQTTLVRRLMPLLPSLVRERDAA